MVFAVVVVVLLVAVAAAVGVSVVGAGEAATLAVLLPPDLNGLENWCQPDYVATADHGWRCNEL